jgi:hypothetical protein
MLARISTALLAFILASMVPLQGQDQSESVGSAGPIATDRPAITDSSVVVPVGSLQVENGFLETSSQGQSMLDGSESLVRVGIAKKTELRFTVPDYFYNLSAGGGPSSGFGDFAVGVKQQLGPTLGKFDVSVVGFLSFPTGSNTVSSGGYDPGLQVPWSRALSGNWTAAGMFSVYWPTQGRTRNPEPASSSCAPGDGLLTTLARSPLRGRDHTIRCLRVRGCRSRLGSVSACNPDTAPLSEPIRVLAEIESGQVLRLRDGIAGHRCDVSRGEPDS